MRKRPDLARLEQEIAQARDDLSDSWAALRARIPSRSRKKLPNAHAAAKPSAAKPEGLPFMARLAGVVGLGMVLSRICSRGRLPEGRRR